MILACRPKGDGCDDCGQLTPPYLVVGSAVHGELAFFDLRDLHPIRTNSMTGWATACELLPNGNQLIVADNETGALKIYALLEFGLLSHVSVAGTPVDVRVARNSRNAFLITNNSRYYRFDLASLEADTMFTGQNPRRIRVRPQEDLFTWIACRGDSTVRVVKELTFEEELSISFSAPCTDIAFSPDGGVAYCAAPGSNAIYVLSASTGQFFDSLHFTADVVDLSMSQTGNYLLAVDSVGGNAELFDLSRQTSTPLQLGESAIRPGYSVSSLAFFVVCPSDTFVLRLDPFSDPPRVTDTLRVDPIPQCLSFLE